ncbi:MAG: hypothetical protein NTW19_00460 [Planctomycetota bacterium]|nr:hypothetical protein [Planctomycetota bacterium]
MKLGIILSVVIVLGILVFFFVSTRGVADMPTSATRAEKLEKVTFAPGLPKIVDAGDPNIDAKLAYDKVFALYADRHKDFDRSEVPTILADQMTGLLIDALPAGKFPPGFVDEYVPMSLLEQPEFGEALAAISDVVGKRIASAAEKGDVPYAAKAGFALWAMGQRLNEHCVRLHNRLQGLVMMKTAGEKLYPLVDKLPERPKFKDELSKWIEPLDKIETEWNSKVKLIWAPVAPSVADLINIAKNDKDPSFRVEAMLYLGVAKFNPKSNANKRVLLATLAEGKTDPEPLVAKAAETADAMTMEEMRRMK